MTTRIRTQSPRPSAPRRMGWAVALSSVAAWYDFLIFPIVALSYFAPVFFTGRSDPQALTALTGLWLLAYALRPVGALIFGFWGDSGRRTHALAGAIALVSIGSGAIGLLPAASDWAVPALIACRVLTGIGLGGAWSGAMVLAAERAVDGRSGQGAVAQIGLPLAMLATLGAVALFVLMPAGASLAWGWRLPFLGSLVFLLLVPFLVLAVPDRPLPERPLLCAQTDAPRHRLTAALVGGVLACGFASALTFFHGLFALHFAGPDSEVPGLLYLAGAAISAGGALAGVGIGAWLLRRVPAWGVVLLGGLLSSGVFLVVLILLALVSINWASLLLPASVGALGIGYAGLPTLLADAFAPAQRYTGVALVSSLAGLPGAAVPLAIYDFAGGHAISDFVWLVLIFMGLAGLSALGALALNMKRPDRSDDISPLVDKALPS